MWKNIGGGYEDRSKQPPHGGQHDKAHDREDEYRKHSRQQQQEEEHHRHGGSRHEPEHPYGRDGPDSKDRQNWIRATRLPDGTIKLPNGALLRPSQPGYPTKMSGPDNMRAMGRGGNKGSSSQVNGMPAFHSGNDWFWSFGKASPLAAPKQAVTSGANTPTTVSLQSMTTPAAAGAGPGLKALLTGSTATTQGMQAVSTTPEVMYWAYNAAGEMVPVYAESQGTLSAADATSTEAYEEVPEGVAAVSTAAAASAGSAQAQDTVADLAAYTESADDYEEVPTVATGVFAATANVPTTASANQLSSSTAAGSKVTAAAATPSSSTAATVATAATSKAATAATATPSSGTAVTAATAATSTAATAAAAAPAVAKAPAAINESGEEVLTLSAIEVKIA